jgi:hypothetical protein
MDVPKSLEETVTKVHIANWIDTFREFDGARELSVSVTPLVLNAFHVPLVDKYDNLFTF